MKPTPGEERFSEKMIAEYQKMLEDKHAFSVELRDPIGKVIAGSFGTIKDGEVHAESIFYPYPNIQNKMTLNEILNALNGVPQEVRAPMGTAGAAAATSKVAAQKPAVEGTEAATIALDFLFERLRVAGYEWINSGMVTHYTDLRHGKYVTWEEFMALVKNTRAKKLPPPDLSRH